MIGNVPYQAHTEHNTIIKHLSSSKLSDLVAREIVTYILQNNIHSGQTIPSEKQFSEYFGIGRTSIREGISKLTSIGLLQPIQGYGIILNRITIDSYFTTMENSILKDFIEMDEQEIFELIDTRYMIETLACQNYLQEGSPEDLIPLKASLEDLHNSVNEHPLFMKHDVRFHQYIVSLSKNRIMSFLYSLIRELVAIEIKTLLPLKGIPAVQNEHVAIYNALERKDTNVFEYLRDHLEKIKIIHLENSK